MNTPVSTSGNPDSSGNRDAVAAKPSAAASRGWSIRVSIASVVVFSMLLVGVVVIALGWQGARQSLLDTAARAASDSGSLVTERTRRLLEPAQSTLRQLTFDPIVSTRSLEGRLERLFMFAEELAVNPLISAVYVGFDDGQFFLARPLDSEPVRKRFNAPPKSNFVIQSVALAANGKDRVGEQYFFDAENRLVERRAVPEYTFDPRTRPWYQKADNTIAQVLTEPYVFFTTRQVGLTLSQSARGGGAVVGIDMVLDDLSASLGDMRMTPSAELALVDGHGQVLAHPDMSKVLVEGDGRFSFRPIKELDVPALRQFAGLDAPQLQPRFFDVAGRETLGVVLPFDVWPGQSMRLLVTAPVDELLGDLHAKRNHMIMLVAGLVTLMLPLGWLAGSRMGHSLDWLTQRAQRISAFDFSGSRGQTSFVTEVNQLSSVMQEMSTTIQSFLRLSQLMATETEVEKMLDKVLHQLLQATRCTGAAVYLWNDDTQRMELSAVDGTDTERFPASLHYQPGQTGLGADVVSGTADAHMLTELRGRTGKLEGVLLLVYPVASGHAGQASFVQFVQQLSGMLAVSIETRQLIDAQKKLLDAVIRLMADAIDAKSPYTGGHCERVPELATMLVDRMCADTSGPYASFSMTEDERYEFYLGAWLHDCGKVTSPEHIVDKATKLEVIYNRIHEIRTRFEVLWRDAEISHLQRLLAGADAATSQAEWLARQQQLQADFAFVAQCNVGGEFMANEAITRLQGIASQPWVRHFDNRLGLSSEEARRLADVQHEAALPVAETLLADRPEHLVVWGDRKPAVEKNDPANKHGFDMVLPAHRQNMGELYNLSIRRGTLTDEDRFKINDHIVQTLIMLKGLPWPQHLARVPEIAATHHEKVDGTGYPRKLPVERLSVADRVMALADIFEALTAADRPYKAPKSLTESLRIMAFMCKDKHLDTDLFRYFLHSGLWRAFADRFMQPAQIDAVDIAAIEKLLPNT